MASALRSVYESLRMGGGAKQALSRLARFDARIDLDAAAVTRLDSYVGAAAGGREAAAGGRDASGGAETR